LQVVVCDYINLTFLSLLGTKSNSNGAAKGLSSERGTSSNATVGCASDHRSRGATKQTALEHVSITEAMLHVSFDRGTMGAVNKNNSEAQSDDDINYVDEKACIMRIRDEMYSSYPVEVATTSCTSAVLYRNDNYDDWLMDAPAVAFIELHGHSNFGHSMEKCMHCLGKKKKGSVPPSIRHSKECPFNKFVFEEPVIDNHVSIVYFYVKNQKKIQKIMCKVQYVLWEKMKTKKKK